MRLYNDIFWFRFSSSIRVDIALPFSTHLFFTKLIASLFCFCKASIAMWMYLRISVYHFASFVNIFTRYLISRYCLILIFPIHIPNLEIFIFLTTKNSVFYQLIVRRFFSIVFINFSRRCWDFHSLSAIRTVSPAYLILMRSL